MIYVPDIACFWRCSVYVILKTILLLFACFLSTTRVASTKFVRKLLHVHEFWLQFSRLSHFIYPDLSTSHSCFLDCIPSVERLSSSVSLIFGPWTFTEWHRQRLCKFLLCSIITKCQFCFKFDHSKLKFSWLVDVGILKQFGSYGVLDENRQNRFSFDTCYIVKQQHLLQFV